MQVVQFSKSDLLNGGGGAVAMNRLNAGLRKEGVNSRILCNIKTTDTPYSEVIKIPRSCSKVEKKLAPIFNRFGLNEIYILNSFFLKRNKIFEACDVVNYHGIHGGFFNYLSLPLLTQNKPSVITLHDMWAYTGHCSYSYDCERWKTGCGKCPYPKNHPPIERDTTRLHWRLKDFTYRHSNIAIVTLSTAQHKEVNQSLLSRFHVHFIPNGVDTNIFKPHDSMKCRQILGIPNSKRVVMFGAIQGKQHNKGGDLLNRALQSLPKVLKNEIMLLTIGRGSDSISRKTGILSLNLGFVSDDRLKAIVYSAADIFVSPTRAESFGLVALESMACGTPVVAFGVGGLLDLVHTGVTGYQAKPGDVDDLSKGINKLITDKQSLCVLGENSRLFAVEKFSLQLQVERYIHLYRELISLR